MPRFSNPKLINTQTKSNKPIENTPKTLTNQQKDSSIIIRDTMSVKVCISNLKKFSDSYSLEMLGKKAQHNIDMFRIIDESKSVVIADITENGDLTLNDDYKHDHLLMNLIITFFTTNAKVENTYTY